MLEWHEYIEQLLKNKSSFDDVSLSFGESQTTKGVPPIIKTSILMLDKMLEHQGKYNIIVFPERVQSIFIFTLMELLHNIAEGKIEKDYDPSSFQYGEKLKFGNAVVEFIEVEKRENKRCVKVRMADLVYSAPIEYLPLFQRTNTLMPLSKYKKFDEEWREAKKRIAVLLPDEKQLSVLADYKTHMGSSIFNMTSIIHTKEMIANNRLCGEKLGDILMIGQADYTGAVHSIGAGQMAGNPAIILAADLYAILAAVEKGNPIQSIIIDASDSNRIQTQMDALDNLIRLRIPIICVTDIVNSFDLQSFETRGFNTWRWDESSITNSLYDITPLSSDRKIKNCATRNLEYTAVGGYEINDAIKKLSSRKSESQEYSAKMIELFDNLNALAFTALRNIITFGSSEIEHAHTLLSECLCTLNSEMAYLDPATYKVYKETIGDLDKIYSTGYQLLKQSALAERLQMQNYEVVCIIVPERSDNKLIQNYWQTWCRKKRLHTIIHVLYPAEYYPAGCLQFSVTVVVGWLSRAIMKKILYSFNTQKYVVLLYDYEQNWKNYSTNKWNTALNSSGNKTIINYSFSNDRVSISPNYFTGIPKPEVIDTSVVDELNEIELVLRQNKFRQYVARGGTRPASETAEAIPVNYVGGYLTFYRIGHKVLSATKVITQDAEKIDTVLPDQLQVGDFVVVREADRDLIKEMADIILENSGKHGLRELAMKWKEALEIEQLFSTPEEIYRKLVDVGCTKGYPTVRSWLMDEDIISPQQKQDMQYIAAITKSGVVNELLDQIYDAAQEVRSVHVQVGRVLSAKLRSRIVEALENCGDIDPFNIWEPIEMSIEGIGNVRVLKIIDIGSPIVIDIADTNRLIEE